MLDNFESEYVKEVIKNLKLIKSNSIYDVSIVLERVIEDLEDILHD